MVKKNLFVKPNEQSETSFNFAMARKGARKWTFALSQMSKRKFAFILPWRENVRESKPLFLQPTTNNFYPYPH